MFIIKWEHKVDTEWKGNGVPQDKSENEIKENVKSLNKTFSKIFHWYEKV